MSGFKNSSRRKFIQQTALAGSGILLTNSMHLFAQQIQTL